MSDAKKEGSVIAWLLIAGAGVLCAIVGIGAFITDVFIMSPDRPAHGIAGTMLLFLFGTLSWLCWHMLHTCTVKPEES